LRLCVGPGEGAAEAVSEIFGPVDDAPVGAFDASAAFASAGVVSPGFATEAEDEVGPVEATFGSFTAEAAAVAAIAAAVALAEGVAASAVSAGLAAS
jgi:hypothetical protein